jgi:hypothetical protein
MFWVDAYGGAIFLQCVSVLVERCCAYKCASHHGQFIYVKPNGQTGSRAVFSGTSVTHCKSECIDGGDQKGNLAFERSAMIRGKNVNISNPWAFGDGSALYCDIACTEAEWKFGLFHYAEGPTTLWIGSSVMNISFSAFVGNRNSRDHSATRVIWLTHKGGGVHLSLSDCRFKENKFMGEWVILFGSGNAASFSLQNCDLDVELPSGPTYKDMTNNRENLSFPMTICVNAQNTSSVNCIVHFVCPTDSFTKSRTFSKSNSFTQSVRFSRSGTFVGTSSFAPTEAVSRTRKLIVTMNFSLTFDFNESINLSESNGFSDSWNSTKSPDSKISRAFSSTFAFCSTNQNSNSNLVSQSVQGFSGTKNFSHSSVRKSSSMFSVSQKFSSTQQIVPSNQLSFSESISESNRPFSGTKNSSGSATHSQSNRFSPSQAFCSTKGHSMTVAFSSTKLLSSSNQISNSLSESHQGFSGTKSFSDSSKHPLSNRFSASQRFSSTHGYSVTSTFSETMVEFSETKHFSHSHSLISNDRATVSGPTESWFKDSEAPNVKGQNVIGIVTGSAIGIIVVCGAIIGFIVLYRRRGNQSNEESNSTGNCDEADIGALEDIGMSQENPLSDIHGYYDDNNGADLWE